MTEEGKAQIVAAAAGALTDEQKAQTLREAAASLTEKQRAEIRNGYIEQTMAGGEVTSQINGAVRAVGGIEELTDGLSTLYSNTEIFKAVANELQKRPARSKTVQMN